MSHPVSGHVAVMEDANGVPMYNHKTLHMELGRGDLANRVITVGSVGRAKLIAKHFDADKPVNTFHSSREFTTFSGYYQGVYCSIVAIGMGPAMMDFFVRESRAVVDGPMAIVRYGTCGGLSEIALPGKVAIATGGSGYVVRNPNAFTHLYDAGAKHKNENPYFFFDTCPSDASLSDLIKKTLAEDLGDDSYVEGVNVTADSFYSSQGRQDCRFADDNHNLVEEIKRQYPNATSMEMETFIMLQLAKCSQIPIKATAAAIIIANRLTGNVLEGDVLQRIEEIGGRAVLHAISKIEF